MGRSRFGPSQRTDYEKNEDSIVLPSDIDPLETAPFAAKHLMNGRAWDAVRASYARLSLIES
jgi:hypothetical protein